MQARGYANIDYVMLFRIVRPASEVNTSANQSAANDSMHCGLTTATSETLKPKQRFTLISGRVRSKQSLNLR